MAITRSMTRKLSRPSFYSLDISSGSSNIFIRESRDCQGNPTREVIDIRRTSQQRPQQRRSSVLTRSSSVPSSGRPTITRRPPRRGSAAALRRNLQKSRGSSLWDHSPRSSLSEKPAPMSAYQPSLMLRAFRGLGGQVEREMQQMLALQLGVLEHFKQWNRVERTQLLQAVPEMIKGLEKVRSQSDALAGWLQRLGAIVEQDLAAPACSSDSFSLGSSPEADDHVLTGWQGSGDVFSDVFSDS